MRFIWQRQERLDVAGRNEEYLRDFFFCAQPKAKTTLYMLFQEFSRHVNTEMFVLRAITAPALVKITRKKHQVQSIAIRVMRPIIETPNPDVINYDVDLIANTSCICSPCPNKQLIQVFFRCVWPPVYGRCPQFVSLDTGRSRYRYGVIQVERWR